MKTLNNIFEALVSKHTMCEALVKGNASKQLSTNYKVYKLENSINRIYGVLVTDIDELNVLLSNFKMGKIIVNLIKHSVLHKENEEQIFVYPILFKGNTRLTHVKTKKHARKEFDYTITYMQDVKLNQVSVEYWNKKHWNVVKKNENS